MAKIDSVRIFHSPNDLGGLENVRGPGMPVTEEIIRQASDLSAANNAREALSVLENVTGVSEAPAALQEKYYVQLSWIYIRLGTNDTPEGSANYGKALAAAEAIDTPETLKCVATVLAQSLEHRDDPRLFAIAKNLDLIENPTILNAITLRASKGEVDEPLIKELQGLIQNTFSRPEITANIKPVFGHILQNFGKLHLNVLKDPELAVIQFQQSLLFYNPDEKSHLPHIGAAFFWMGQANKDSEGPLAQHTTEVASQLAKMFVAGDGYLTDQKVEQSRTLRAALRKQIFEE